MQEALPGVDLSASGLQTVALVFKRDTPKMELSNLLNAPLLECLELDFPRLNGLKLSMDINVQRHEKPFLFTLVSRNGSRLQDKRFWQALEVGFGPQSNGKSPGREFLLHQTLLKERWNDMFRDDYMKSYYNAAHTRAAKAKRSRETLAPRSCDHRLFESSKRLCEECVCERCESGSTGGRCY